MNKCRASSFLDRFCQYGVIAQLVFRSFDGVLFGWICKMCFLAYFDMLGLVLMHLLSCSTVFLTYSDNMSDVRKGIRTCKTCIGSIPERVATLVQNISAQTV